MLQSGKQALDAVMLEKGRMEAESVMRIERAKVAGPDYYTRATSRSGGSA